MSANDTYAEVTEPSTGLESPISPALNLAIHNPSEQAHMGTWCGSTSQAGQGFEPPDPAKGVPAYEDSPSACPCLKDYLSVLGTGTIPFWSLRAPPHTHESTS